MGYRTKFTDAVCCLKDGGLAESAAERLLTDVITETVETMDVIDESNDVIPEMSDTEYSLCMDILGRLTAGGMGFGAATVLLAMYAVSVQDRCERTLRMMA